MASFLDVRDRATAEFMTRFYHHLNKGLPKDEALRAVQVEFIRGGIDVQDKSGKTQIKDYSSPYFWAPSQPLR